MFRSYFSPNYRQIRGSGRLPNMIRRNSTSLAADALPSCAKTMAPGGAVAGLIVTAHSASPGFCGPCHPQNQEGERFIDHDINNATTLCSMKPVK
jgi:hypothetical protein